MTSPSATWWRHRIALVAGPVVAAALVGATYQGVATALERRALPHPGQLVEVGGHQLHLHCTGEGTPTVVLEAPAGAPSAGWAPVQSRVSAFARVCSYDRAGLGWSESDASAYDPNRVPEDLRALLAAANTKGPFVLAGQGLGAAFVQLFGRRFPGDTIGLVLIDAPSSELPTAPGYPESWGRRPALWPWLARFGLLRLSGGLAGFADGLEGADRNAVRAFFNRPDHLSRAASELAGWDETVVLAASAPRAPGIPEIRVQAAGETRLGLVTDPAAIDQTVSAIRQASRQDR